MTTIAADAPQEAASNHSTGRLEFVDEQLLTTSARSTASVHQEGPYHCRSPFVIMPKQRTHYMRAATLLQGDEVGLRVVIRHKGSISTELGDCATNVTVALRFEFLRSVCDSVRC